MTKLTGYQIEYISRVLHRAAKNDQAEGNPQYVRQLAELLDKTETATLKFFRDSELSDRNPKSPNYKPLSPRKFDTPMAAQSRLEGRRVRRAPDSK